MTRDLVIGIDGGTGGVRVFVFDRYGNIVSKGSHPYGTSYPQNGYAEQNPNDWWNAAKLGVRQAMSGISASRVAALCAATTSCTVVCCSGNGTALREALLWMDVRSAEESRQILDKTGQALSAELFVCKALWLKSHQEELWNQTEVLCEYQDYLNFKLTGEWCFSVNIACNWGYDSRKAGFYTTFYEAIGLSDALAKIPKRALRVGEVIGTLCKTAAEELGLDRGVAVIQGGIDSSVGMLGMGVVEQGKLALMTGSSNLAMAVTKAPMFGNAGDINLGPDFLLEGYYTSVRGQTSTGSILEWFKREFCRDLGEDAFGLLDKEAGMVPAGSCGLLVLDYWQGNRSPHNDPDAKGAILGLAMSTTRAQIFRAVMEGIAFGTQDMLREFAEKGEKFESINISGGTTRSDLFLQIHADVSGVRLNVTSDYSVVLGCAVVAALAAGWYGSLREATGGMVRCKKQVLPDNERHKIYAKLFEKYRGLYPCLKNERVF